jgi:hypothetical protein
MPLYREEKLGEMSDSNPTLPDANALNLEGKSLFLFKCPSVNPEDTK